MFLLSTLNGQKLALKVTNPCLRSLKLLLKNDDLVLMASYKLLSHFFVFFIYFSQFSIKFSAEVFL